ncbi:MAG: NACHT domain-containing protein, partial [Methylococcaceae bacterium]|nr:NACHT domain-containing protein [Methylococcaceae bacterium]
MNPPYDLSISKPVSVWNKPLKIEPKNFFLNLAKAVFKGAQGEFEDATENLADAFVDLSSEDKAGQLAWLLIYNALTKALSGVLLDCQDIFELIDAPDETKQQQLSAILSNHFEQIDVGINAEFFQHPQQLPLLQEFGKSLQHWLTGLGLNTSQAQALAQRLPDRFALELHSEWLKEPERYANITTAVQTPFTQAAQQQRRWLQYHAWLREQVNQRMFAEVFSLQSVYVPLRAYYQEQPKEQHHRSVADTEQDSKKLVVDLQTELADWVNHFNADDAIRLLSGGPGCGKSSFCKMFAAHIAEHSAVKVLFVPLHLFDLSADLIDAVARFIAQNRYLEGSPLNVKQGESRLLVIFDGLDEISMQGKAAAQAAQEFIDELLRKLNGFNGQQLQRQFIISGRDLVVQANANKFRSTKQILHILPYFVDEQDRKSYQDPQMLLDEDQRHLWWHNYGKASGKAYTEMPTALASRNLTEITRWPLLNYLVALSFDRQQLDFDAATTLNQVYSDLLKAVYERQYEGKNRKHQGAGNLAFKDFCRILEEIALAVWHGDGRTTTVEYIQSRCNKSNLHRYLEEFQEGAEKGVTRLLTAFYFRQSGEVKGDKTFEFTHKSFGEYLIACRLVRMLDVVQSEWQRHEDDPDRGMDLRKILIDWAEIFGTTTIDDYLYQFLQNQVALAKPEKVNQWQHLLCRLIESAMAHGMPMEKLDLHSFQEMFRQSCNAENALFAMHSACAKNSQQVLEIEWPSEDSFGNCMHRLRSSDSYIPLDYLAFLDLSDSNLRYQNFFCADLSYAKLKYTDASGVTLTEATLENIDAEGAEFGFSMLENANLQNANLERANFRGASLERANL